jgi:hypothetical protein
MSQSPFRLIIKGIHVEASTAADAFELIQISSAAGAAAVSAAINGAAAPAKVAVPIAPASQNVDPQLVRLTGDFLHTIRSGGKTGVSTDLIIQALDVPHGRAIGSRLALVNRLLQAIGMPRKQDVYLNKKTSKGRIWKPGKAIESAISAIDQQMANQL